MAANDPSPTSPSGSRLVRAAQVIIVSGVMFTFISYWRTAAIVLCDLASTSYYIGGIVEQSVGPAAPWFISAVMFFSFAVNLVYIESCALFVRGGVYRTVKTAMGGFLGKLAVSALMFDYILTGPISSVSAGQYIVGLGLQLYSYFNGVPVDPATQKILKSWGSVLIAIAIAVYFFRLNLVGIHESSGKALKIMITTTVMAVLLIGWCLATLALEGGPRNSVPLQPKLVERVNAEGHPVHPLGFLKNTGLATSMANLSGDDWLSLIGVFGILIAFGHSILAMSGAETLAQVYREVESPKLPNFKKATYIVFLYSLALTGGISFLAVMLIPEAERTGEYSENLLGGLAMNVWGPMELRLALNAFVVIVGFLILSGAVNTAIIGSNGVLNRVAEDGVIPAWFLKPHPKYGTTYRLLVLILLFQLFTIVASRGDVLILGEAYAFGVVWSFLFNSLAMMVLRFKDKTPRQYKVPLNITIGKVELPIGLGLVFCVLLMSAIANLLTKQIATIAGLCFTGGFMALFTVTEFVHERKLKGKKHEHLEQFNQQVTEEVTATSLGLSHEYHKLVAIRSPQNLFMLEKALAEADPATTDVVVMTAKVAPQGTLPDATHPDLDNYDQQLMTAVVTRAEKAGKEIKPLIVPTNNPLHAVLRTAKDLNAQELIMGASNKFTAEEQLDQIAFYWISLHDGQPTPLTVRLLSRNRDVYLDLEGGNRIPKISERKARTVAELRAAGVGVDRVLLAHDGTQAGSDLFQAVLTMLDSAVILDLIATTQEADLGSMIHDQERAHHLGREVEIHRLEGDWGSATVKLAQEGQFDLIILAMPGSRSQENDKPWEPWCETVLRQAHCPIFLVARPVPPQQVDE